MSKDKNQLNKPTPYDVGRYGGLSGKPGHSGGSGEKSPYDLNSTRSGNRSHPTRSSNSK
jgi:hypothetical protein